MEKPIPTDFVGTGSRPDVHRGGRFIREKAQRILRVLVLSVATPSRYIGME
ncbi:MAG: hypothetical protein QME51_05835 [Planctomycetota bacterium]|nr:hypothetical protein [Planctomycetota bacterium]MDI6787872.1 hypothetical protein [Planctomycetota bacterium]